MNNLDCRKQDRDKINSLCLKVFKIRLIALKELINNKMQDLKVDLTISLFKVMSKGQSAEILVKI